MGYKLDFPSVQFEIVSGTSCAICPNKSLQSLKSVDKKYSTLLPDARIRQLFVLGSAVSSYLARVGQIFAEEIAASKTPIRQSSAFSLIQVFARGEALFALREEIASTLTVNSNTSELRSLAFQLALESQDTFGDYHSAVSRLTLSDSVFSSLPAVLEFLPALTALNHIATSYLDDVDAIYAQQIALS